jgi:hypothetical protein
MRNCTLLSLKEALKCENERERLAALPVRLKGREHEIFIWLRWAL